MMIKGIDVSHYEPPVDWVRAKSGGVAWMYTKATEGIHSQDSMLRTHNNGARIAGVLTGAYHFFHASQPAHAQADNFLNATQGMSFDMPPVLDWESSSADGQPRDIQMQRAQVWLDLVSGATKRTPIIYGGESFLRELVLPSTFVKYPLWLAHYGVGETGIRIPTPWGKWTLWQYTDAGLVDGLAPGHHVDTNWFNGSMDDLSRLAKG